MQKHLWFGVAAIALLAIHSTPAQAQYHSFVPRDKSVVVDMSVLDGGPVNVPPRGTPRFKKLTPPPSAPNASLGVFPEDLVPVTPESQAVPKDAVMSMPPLMPADDKIPAPNVPVELPKDELSEPLRLTPPELPVAADVPAIMPITPEGPIMSRPPAANAVAADAVKKAPLPPATEASPRRVPLSDMLNSHSPSMKMPVAAPAPMSAPEILPPPATAEIVPQPVYTPPEPPVVQATPAAPRRVLKPSTAPDMPEEFVAEAPQAPMPTPAPRVLKPETPAFVPPAPPVSYPSYATQPGQISAPAKPSAHVDMPTRKPALPAEKEPALPAPKPAAVETPVSLKAEEMSELPAMDVTADVAPPAVTKQEETKKAQAKKPIVLKPEPEQSVPVIEETPVLEVAVEQPPASAAETPAPENFAAVPSASDLSIDFTGASSDLSAEAQQKLKAIVAQLKDMGDSRLQVRAYATGEDGSKSSARRISLSRALTVRSFLMDAGIKPTRVDVRAMGTETDRSPLDRVDLIFAK